MLQQLFEYIKKEWAVLKSALGSFIGLTLLCVVAGFGAGRLYYSGQVETLRGQLDAAHSQVSRYRVALGIDKASQGELVELNNQELSLRAQSIVAKLRELSRTLDDRMQNLRNLVKSGKVKESDETDQRMKIWEQVADDFDDNLASDALNIDNELYRRLSPEALSHVVRVPAFRSEEGTRVTVLGIMRGSALGVLYFRPLSDEIEQMSKLLPDK